MSKKITITEQIAELQEENERLKELEKLFDKACQINFGYSAKNIRKMIEKSEDPCSNFETKMRAFFGLKTDKDLANFISLICTESCLKYYRDNTSETN